MDHPYELNLCKCIEKIDEGLYKNLNQIETYPEEIAKSALGILLEFACQSQNVTLISLARKKVKEINLNWLHATIPQIFSDHISLEDEWEYRRFCELLNEIAPHLLPSIITAGEQSENQDIRDAAQDFK